MPNDQLVFLTDPDQLSREAELRDYFGPRADKFITIYRTMRPGPDGRVPFRLFGGFIWPAFFVGPVWFFYRKLWNAAWSVTALLVVTNTLAFLYPKLPVEKLGLPLAIVLAGSGGRYCVSNAINRLGAARVAGGGILQPDQVRRLGGVSVTAAWISGVLYGLLIALGIIGIILMVHEGVQP